MAENGNAALSALAREFRVLKDRKAEIEADLKDINERIKNIEVERLPTMMDDCDVSKFNVEGVGSIYQQVKVYAYVKKEDEEKFHDWLRAGGHEDLIRAYVFPQTLNAFAKEQLENGEELPAWLNAAKVPVAVLRRK
jgi:seryl-tRNA synthetase